MRTTELFRSWPYMAAALCGAGLLVRSALIGRAARNRSRSTAMPIAQNAASANASAASASLFGATWAWRWAWLVLLGLHLFGLVFPSALIRWNANPARLYALEGLGAMAGAVSLGAWASVVWRHLGRGQPSQGNHAGRLADLGDSAFLGALLVAMISGLLSALLLRWASSWGAATLTPYLRSVLGGQPQAQLMTELPLLPRLHVAATFTAIALLPLTRIAPALLWPVHRAMEWAVRPVVRLNDAADRWLRDHSPARLLWPEDEDADTSAGTRRRARKHRGYPGGPGSGVDGADVIVATGGTPSRSPLPPSP